MSKKTPAQRALISRRRFLGFAAAAGFAPAFVSRNAAAAVRLRLGLIGFGRQGRELFAQANATGDVEVAAVADVFEPHRALAQSSKADVYAHWQEMISRKDLDGIMIAAPDHWHAPMAIAAMEAGKDVYCEPPMALRKEDARAVFDCARRMDRRLQVGVPELAEDQWRQAAGLIREGRIGRVVWAQGGYGNSDQNSAAPLGPVNADTLDWHAFHGGVDGGFDAQRFVAWRNYWDYSGGAATETLYGKLAALMVAVGAELPATVSAAGGVYAGDGREAPDSFVMHADYNRGHTIVLASSMARKKDIPAIIRGEEGSIEFLGDRIRITPESTSGEPTDIAVPARPSLLAEWTGCIRTRRTCSCNEDIGHKTTVAIAMALDAYRLEKTMTA
jgi:predicted dehydrogenase